MLPFDEQTLPYAVPDTIVDTFRRDWARLAAPGSRHSGAERVMIAAETRRARAGEAPSHELPAATLEAARRIATSASTIRREWVEHLAAVGLPEAAYVETLGIVARTLAVDTFHRALGAELEPLPAPEPGQPTGAVNPSARPSKGFVAMARGTSTWWAVSLVPDAFEGMEEFHNTLYLSPQEMMLGNAPRLLSRPQIELVAARTSAVNECFY